MAEARPEAVGAADDSNRNPGAAAASTQRTKQTPIQVHMTSEGTVFFWGSVGIAITALGLGENALLLAACMVIAAAVVTRRAVRRNLQGLRVSRHVPRRARVGRRSAIRWTIQDEASREHLGIQLRERPGTGVTPRALDVSVPHVAARGTASATSEVVWRRRGLRRWRGPDVHTRYPVGMFLASLRTTWSDQVLVRPHEGRIGAGLRRRLASYGRPSRAVAQLTQGMDEFFGVRAWRDGDDPRRVHAPTTARRGEPIVSEWHDTLGREVLVVLGGGGTFAAHERAVSAAATLWRELIQRGLPAQLVWDLARKQGSVQARGHAVLRARERGLDALATVRHRGRRPFTRLRELARGGRPLCVIVLAPRPSKRWLPKLRAQLGRGRELVVIETTGSTLRPWFEDIP